MVTIFAIFIIVGAGVKKVVADSKAKTNNTTVVVSNDDSVSNNTFGVFDSVTNCEMTAPEGYVTTNQPSSNKETTVLTSEPSEALSNDRASPYTIDSS